MEKYVVIKLGSKQFLVQEGDTIELERQPKPLKIDVLMFSQGGKVLIGEPELKEVSVKASVLEEKLGKKTRVARFKKKSGYEKVKGHRQPVSIVRIDKIILSDAGKEAIETKKTGGRAAAAKGPEKAKTVKKESSKLKEKK